MEVASKVVGVDGGSYDGSSESDKADSTVGSAGSPGAESYAVGTSEYSSVSGGDPVSGSVAAEESSAVSSKSARSSSDARTSAGDASRSTE